MLFHSSLMLINSSLIVSHNEIKARNVQSPLNASRTKNHFSVSVSHNFLLYIWTKTKKLKQETTRKKIKQYKETQTLNKFLSDFLAFMFLQRWTKLIHAKLKKKMLIQAVLFVLFWLQLCCMCSSFFPISGPCSRSRSYQGRSKI